MGVKVKTASGETIEVDSATAQEGLQRGEFQPADGPVQLARGKEIGEVDAPNLATALAQGWRIADAEEQRQTKLRAEESDLGSTLYHGGAAVGRGLSFGLTDTLATAMGADPERLKVGREELGAGAAALEVGGAVLPAALSGGTGLAGTLARLTPAGRVASVAGKAGAAVRGGGGIGRAALGAGVEGAIEGAAEGAGAVLTQAELENDRLSGERVVAGAGMGAGLGFLLSGAIGAGGAGLQRAVSTPQDGAGRMLARGADEIEPSGLQAADGGGEWKDSVSGAWSTLAGVDKDALRRGLDDLGTEEGVARIVADVEDVREATGRAIKSATDPMNEAWAALRKTTGGEARVGNAERLMTGQERAAAVDRAMDFLRSERRRVDLQLEDRLLPKPARTDLERIRRANELAMDRVAKNRDGADAFRAIDAYKQEADYLASGRRTQASGPGPDPEVRRSVPILESYGNGARNHLYDPRIYGEAAKAHQASNAVWSEAIAAEERLRKKSPALARMLKSGEEADLDTALRLASMRTRASGETKVSAFDEVIDARLRAVAELRKNNDVPREVIRQIDDFERATKAMRKQLDEQAEHAKTAHAFWRMRKGETNASPSQTVFSTIGPALGGLAGSTFGPLGAAAGFALGQVMAPSRLLKAAAHVKHTLGRARFLEDGAISGFGELARGAKSALAKAAKGTGKNAARTVRSAALVRERRKARENRLKATIRRVAQLAHNPSALGTELRDDEFAAAAPGAARSAMFTAAQAIQFLQSVAPQAYQPTFMGGVELYDPVELDRYERYVEAVTAPLEVAAMLGRGTMTVEHADALRAVYPQIYQRLREGILESLGAAEAQGRPVAFAARVQAGILGDVPADDSLRPEMLAAISRATAGASPEDSPDSPALANPSSDGRVVRKAPIRLRSVETDRSRIAMGGEHA